MAMQQRASIRDRYAAQQQRMAIMRQRARHHAHTRVHPRASPPSPASARKLMPARTQQPTRGHEPKPTPGPKLETEHGQRAARSVRVAGAWTQCARAARSLAPYFAAAHDEAARGARTYGVYDVEHPFEDMLETLWDACCCQRSRRNGCGSGSSSDGGAVQASLCSTDASCECGLAAMTSLLRRQEAMASGGDEATHAAWEGACRALWVRLGQETKDPHRWVHARHVLDACARGGNCRCLQADISCCWVQQPPEESIVWLSPTREQDRHLLEVRQALVQYLQHTIDRLDRSS